MTPTVATMNEGGTVTGVLVGALAQSEKDSFLAMLSSGRGGSMNNYLDPPVVSNETFERMADDDDAVVVDVRKIPRAKNPALGRRGSRRDVSARLCERFGSAVARRRPS